MGEPGRPKRGRLAWLIFLSSFLVYQANLRPIGSLDSLPTALLPFSILLDKSLDLDRFAPVLLEGQPFVPYYLHEKDGRFYSSYPIAQPVLLTPLYIPVVAFIDLRRWTPGDLILLARALEKVAAGTLAAASVAVFFLLLDRLTSRRNAIALAAVYGLATPTWATSSQALWQHSGSALLAVLTLLALAWWVENRNAPKFLSIAGVWAGLALMVRPTMGILACLIVVVALQRGAIRALAAFLLPVILCASAVGAWNMWLFQDLRGGYGSAPFTTDLLPGLAGILFSPGRGLFVYCPFFLFAIAGIGRFRKWHQGALSLLLLVSVLFCVFHLIVVSFISIWWGGHCWGPRYLTEMMPFLTLLILPVFDSVMAGARMRAVFACLALYAVFVQSVGVFFYPRGAWDSTPVPVDSRPQRCWDWVDNPIRRTIGGGLALGPHQLIVEWAFHGKDAAVRKMREARYKGF